MWTLSESVSAMKNIYKYRFKIFWSLNPLQEYSEKPSDEKLSEEKIVKDLEKMSDKEKRKLLKKESPELLELTQDLKLKVKCRHHVWV